MEMLLAGTGPATGFPVPGCSCATCSPSAPGAPRPRRPAELRLGSGPDHYRLDADGVVHAPDGTAHRLRAGEVLDLPEGTVEAIGTGDHPVRTVLLIRATDRAEPQPLAWPVLWAPQSGRLTGSTLAGLAGITLSAVLLGPAAELDPGDQLDPGDDQPAPVECALGLARLRAAGCVLASTACLLVGVGHRQGRADRLARCLQHWGATVLPDGTLLDPWSAIGGGATTVRPGGRTLVLGGSASGKSSLAEHLLAAEPAVLYVATGPVVDLRSSPDTDWAQRVSRHQERRPPWWRTEETDAVAQLLAKTDEPLLLDSVGTWLTGVLDRAGAWQEQPGWRARLAAETDALVRAWRARRSPLVAVSDEVGLSVVPATASGRLFRDELGRLNRRLADESERVLFVVAGRVLSDEPVPSDGSVLSDGLVPAGAGTGFRPAPVGGR